MTRLILLFLLLLLFLCPSPAVQTIPQPPPPPPHALEAREWIYKPNEQFPPGSDSLPAPKVCMFSIYMGKIKYSHMPLLISSMNYNPSVRFNIINIVENKDDAKDALEVITKFSKFNNADNVHLEVITMEGFSKLVKDRLNINVKFDIKWAYKMCDYKPTLAYLFPDLVKDNSTYSFWGFADMDIVWGSFKNHASLFSGSEKIIISGWWHSTGAAVFSVNEKWARELFLESKKYASLLADIAYHNLDESGMQINPADIVDGGKWSMDQTQRNVLKDKFHANYKTGKNEFDHMFIDDGDTHDWAGAAIWHMGSLQIVKASKYFPPGRQVLFFHSRKTVESGGFSKPSQPEFSGDAYFQDMVTYGYFLPTYTPLFSRFMCQFHEPGGIKTWASNLHEYKPYDSKCFGKLDKHSYGLA